MLWWRWGGLLLALIALVGDSIVGWFIFTEAELWAVVIHITFVLFWGTGAGLFIASTLSSERISRLDLRSVVFLLPAIFLFPGFGVFAYSLAFIITHIFPAKHTFEMVTDTARGSNLAIPSADVQPLVDILKSNNLEMRREAVADLSKQETPESNELLRQLLSDPMPEIRSDASIALTRIEEEMAINLNEAIERWSAEPGRQELLIELIDQYHTYAVSNVLDEPSQQIYFAKARELIQPLLEESAAEHEFASLWLMAAQINRRLGDETTALQQARMALLLQPDLEQALLQAVELAFSLQAWDILSVLLRSIPASLRKSLLEKQPAISWWESLLVRPGGVARG